LDCSNNFWKYYVGSEDCTGEPYFTLPLNTCLPDSDNTNTTAYGECYFTAVVIKYVYDYQAMCTGEPMSRSVYELNQCIDFEDATYATHSRMYTVSLGMMFLITDYTSRDCSGNGTVISSDVVGICQLDEHWGTSVFLDYFGPTLSPTSGAPSQSPSKAPSGSQPSKSPSKPTTKGPTMKPTKGPTMKPSILVALVTGNPTLVPTTQTTIFSPPTTHAPTVKVVESTLGNAATLTENVGAGIGGGLALVIVMLGVMVITRQCRRKDLDGTAAIAQGGSTTTTHMPVFQNQPNSKGNHTTTTLSSSNPRFYNQRSEGDGGDIEV
jgi:hypothetical protein